jgi:hypothetical protein
VASFSLSIAVKLSSAGREGFEEDAMVAEVM